MYLESKNKFPILYFDATGGLFNRMSEQRNEPFLFPLGKIFFITKIEMHKFSVDKCP